jgi:AraC-like DNA-binding protein
MRQIDTTNPAAHQKARVLSGEPHAARAFELSAGFRVHLIGLYYCEFGSEWNSGGQRESDYVHHIDLAFTGRRQVVHGSRSIDIEPGMAYFLPGNTPVERRCLQRGRVLYLKFRCEWLPGVDPLLDWPERTPTRIGPFARQEWQSWLKRESYSDVNALMRLHAQVENWLAGVLPPLDALLSRHLETHARFTPVFSLVEQKLGADLRISELAKAHGTSLHAFSMAFSSSTRLSPKEYLNRRLNQEALKLVIGSELKIKEVAERLRFTDEFYFSRFFQKLNGVPPSRYRARFRTA